MLILPQDTLAPRQSLVTGRLFEQFTQGAFERYDIALRLSHAAGGGALPAQLQRKTGGYFALGIAPARDLPPLPATGDIDITLTISIDGRAPFDRTRTVPAAQLALAGRNVDVQGKALRMMVVVGAPFNFNIQLAPLPVALAGVVIDDNDPSEPVAGAAVTAAPAPSVTTDIGGRFFIPALPVAETVALHIAGGGGAAERSHRPDFSKPVNTITLSV
ncbi:MAG: hypothetical protein V3R90_10265 [Limibaculum sp.]